MSKCKHDNIQYWNECYGENKEYLRCKDCGAECDVKYVMRINEDNTCEGIFMKVGRWKLPKNSKSK